MKRCSFREQYFLPICVLLLVGSGVLISNNRETNKNYRVSVITSIYKGDQFIEGFMKDIVQQTIFEQCEFILINANSPGNEEQVIQPYLALYPNIKYMKLTSDPGIYGVWNMAIKMASAPFITNANVDDRIAFNCYEVHKKALENNPHIDLVYSDMYVTRVPNETFLTTSSKKVYGLPEFSKKNMRKCIMGNHPMWRKSMHEKHGYFDESYKASGDFEMWLRAVQGGSQFKKIDGIYGLYYSNPEGLSTRPGSIGRKEFAKIVAQYHSVFQ